MDRLRLIYWPVLLASASAVGCGQQAGNAFLGQLVQQTDPGVEIERQYGGVCERDADYAEANALAQRLAAVVPRLGTRCRCLILDSQSRAALSLSDGRIYITRGLYRDLSEPMLAAVLAHEIAHVAARDGKSAAADSHGKLAKEMRADRRACQYLQSAGFTKDGLVDALRLLAAEQPQGWAEARLNAIAK